MRGWIVPHMHRDANLHRRNALVITGLLLSVYSLAGMVYVLALRSADTACEDGRYVEVFYACRDAAWLLALPIIVGIGLVALGLFMFPPTSSCPLGQGTWATAGVYLLGSLVLLPLLATLVTYFAAATYYITYGETEYQTHLVMALVTLVGAVAFVPYLALYTAQGRSHPCCRDAGCFEPCFCDEPTATPTSAAPVRESWQDRAETAWPSPPAPIVREPIAPQPPPPAHVSTTWEAPKAPTTAVGVLRPGPPAASDEADASRPSKTRKVRKTPSKGKSKRSD